MSQRWKPEDNSANSMLDNNGGQGAVQNDRRRSGLGQVRWETSSNSRGIQWNWWCVDVLHRCSTALGHLVQRLIHSRSEDHHSPRTPGRPPCNPPRAASKLATWKLSEETRMLFTWRWGEAPIWKDLWGTWIGDTGWHFSGKSRYSFNCYLVTHTHIPHNTRPCKIVLCDGCDKL